MYVCVVVPFILDVRLVDVPVGVTHEEGHTGFLHIPSSINPDKYSNISGSIFAL